MGGDVRGWAAAALAVSWAEAVVATRVETAALVIRSAGPAAACLALGLPGPDAVGGPDAALWTIGRARGAAWRRAQTVAVALSALDRVLGAGAGAAWLLTSCPRLGLPPAAVPVGPATADARLLASATDGLADGLRSS